MIDIEQIANNYNSKWYVGNSKIEEEQLHLQLEFGMEDGQMDCQQLNRKKTC